MGRSGHAVDYEMEHEGRLALEPAKSSLPTSHDGSHNPSLTGFQLTNDIPFTNMVN